MIAFDAQIMLLSALTTFLSAFLLFAVEPMIGKMILPRFGGSAAVWSTCLVFFQISLLAGYLYAHCLSRWLRPRWQGIVHIGLLTISLAMLPAIPSPARLSGEIDDPTWPILRLLAATIGLPYLLLSATTPLVQAWYVAGNPGASPYRLYALSNAGSMLALLSYPVALEPNLPTRAQGLAWSAGFTLFAVICGILAWRVRASSRIDDTAAEPLRWTEFLLWIGLAACPAGLLLSVTTELTHNIAPIPFLWVLPLALYLLSFIFCFESDLYYRRWLFLPLLALALAGMSFTTYFKEGNPPLLLALLSFSAGLFICAMVLHGELARRRPEPRHLTAFYLAIALGGVAGGLFVGIGAPHLFRDYFEFPALLILCPVVLAVACWRPRWIRLSMAVLAASLTIFLIYVQAFQSENLYAKTWRNFYSVLHTRQRLDSPGVIGLKYLMNGSISHGSQITQAKFRRMPTSYYGPRSGVGRVFDYLENRGPVRAGVIGLGAGVLAGYCRSGDTFRFYEINPLDLAIARREFTFLHDCPSPPVVVIGDARLTLERESPQNFDVLVVDAFSSDSIPVHLLTREAFVLYFHHLSPHGILAVHVSNRYLDLVPVVAGNAADLGKQGIVVDDDKPSEEYLDSTEWALVTADPSVFAEPPFRATGIRKLSAASRLPHWTDDYSNLFRILR